MSWFAFFLYSVLTMFALARANPIQPGTDKVNVTVYYRVTCYWSRQFIKDMLHPTWRILADHMNVNFKPIEYKLKPQLCALKVLENDAALTMDYVMCTLNDEITSCFQTVRNNTESVMRYEKCISTPEGERLLSESYNWPPELKLVPTIYLNGVFNTEARVNLKKAVCDRLTCGKPSVCG